MFWAEIWKISKFFIWKLSVFGSEIFNIFEQACFHNDIYDRSCNLRNRTFRHVCPMKTQITCTCTQSGQSVHYAHENTLYPCLSKMLLVMILIRLHESADWSESLLNTHVQMHISRAQLFKATLAYFVNCFSGFNTQYSDIFCWKNVSASAKATHIFSAKNFSIFAYHSM